MIKPSEYTPATSEVMAEGIREEFSEEEIAVLAVNRLLGSTDRVAMSNRKGHSPIPESNEQIYLFFERFLKSIRERAEGVE